MNNILYACIFLFLLFCHNYWYAIYGTIIFTNYDYKQNMNIINNVTSCDILYPYIKTTSILHYFILPIINECISLFYGIKVILDYNSIDGNCVELEKSFYILFYYTIAIICLIPAIMIIMFIVMCILGYPYICCNKLLTKIKQIDKLKNNNIETYV